MRALDDIRTEYARSPATILTLAIAVVIGGTASAILVIAGPEALSRPKLFRVGLGALVSVLLAAFPLMISFVQATARDRQRNKLQSLSATSLATSESYQIALTALNSIKPASLDKDYALPMLTFATLVVFGCLMFFLGGFQENLFTEKSFILGGTAVLDLADASKIGSYQRGSFLAGGMAFIGCYVYTLGRLLDRINNNDVYPISYYFFAARFVIATIVAIIFRHVLALMGIKDSDSLGAETIVLVGFVTGLAPDLFITAMARRVFQMIKILGSQRDPDGSALPTNLSLLMIEGLSRDKIDRLSELSVDNSQVLANQNPIMLWVRLPYDLPLIVDWIAQAQLYKFVKESGTKQLRLKGLSDICDLDIAISNSTAAASVAKVLDIDPSAIPAYVDILNHDPSFRRLREVREKLGSG